MTTPVQPYSYLVQINMHRIASWNGTGFLIHPRVILTAGHNFRIKRAARINRVRSADFHLGSTSSQQSISDFYYKIEDGNNEFCKLDNPPVYNITEDYAIVILPDSAMYRQAGGCFRLRLYDAAAMKGKEIHIGSYPGDKPYRTLWTDRTTNHFAYKNYMHYDFATEHGSSGAPVWLDNNGTYEVFAIHTNGDGFDDVECNTATVITPAVYDQIKAWCASQGIDITR